MSNISKLTTLSNGLRVVTCEMPQAQTAAMGILASVGGRHEPAKLNGISHFIEHMLFKGTGRRSARRIMQEVEGVGGDINAYTAEDRTCYYAMAAAEYFPRVSDVLCDIYLDPRFSKQDIIRERGVIGEEILMYRDEPSSHVQELLNSTCWPRHPLGRPITGTLETIETLGRQDFLDYRASHYHSSSTIVSAAGRITHEDVVARVSRAFDGLGRGLKPIAKPAPPPPLHPRLTVETRDIQQTQVAMALPAFSRRDKRRHAFLLLNALLGENASSRLFQELREKRGLCYSVSTHPLMLDDSGTLNISVGLDKKNLEKSLRLIFTEFDAFSTKLVGKTALKHAKEYLVGSSRMSLERASNQCMRMGNSVLAQGKIVAPEETHEKIRAVTSEEIRSVAAEVLNPSRLTLALIGPSPDTVMLGRLLGI